MRYTRYSTSLSLQDGPNHGCRGALKYNYLFVDWIACLRGTSEHLGRLETQRQKPYLFLQHISREENTLKLPNLY